MACTSGLTIRAPCRPVGLKRHRSRMWRLRASTLEGVSVSRHGGHLTQLSTVGMDHEHQQASPSGANSLTQSANVVRMPPSDAPEIVWGPGKSPDQIANAMLALAERQRVVIAARIEPDIYAAVRKQVAGVEYNARSRTLKLISAMASELPKPKRLPGSVVIVSADTADQSVAEECKVLADHLGAYTYRVSDVGAANVARLLGQQEALQAADVAIVVCGTDTSLPSLVAGLTQAPVVAVPTSAGAGAALGGLTPLLAVINANCMAVNIDGGLAAAQAATRILRAAARLHEKRSEAEAAAAVIAAAVKAPAPASAVAL